MLINPLRLYLRPETIESTVKLAQSPALAPKVLNCSIQCKCAFTKEQHTFLSLGDTLASLENPFIVTIEKSEFAPEGYWEQFEEIRTHGDLPIGDLTWCPPYKDDLGRIQGNSFEATLYLDEYMFGPVWERLSTGKLPGEIDLGVTGITLEYGTVPDEIHWNYQREKFLAITECEIIYHHSE